MKADLFNRAKFLIPTIFCFILFFPTIYFDFAWDDGDHILSNPLLRSSDFPWHIFSQATHPGNLYRPIFYLSLWLNSSAFGLSPWSFHLVNLLLHCGVVVLVQIFVSNLTGNKTLGIFTAILFGISSAQVEVVAAVSYRTESLAAIFVLVTLILAQKIYSNGIIKLSDFVLLGILAIGGMLSKENGITIILLLPLFLYCYAGDSSRKLQGKSFLPIFLAFGAYLFLRTKAVLVSAELSSSTSIFDNLLIGQDLVDRTIKALCFQGIYLFNLIVPHPIFNDYSYANVSPSFGGTWSEISFVVLALGAIVLGIINLRKNNLIGFGFAWYFLAFSLTSNFFNLIGTHFANRLTYLPSIGVYLIIGGIFAKIIAHKYLRYCGVVYFNLMCLVAFFQASAWQSDRALCEFDLGLGTKSARIYHSLATVSLKEGKLKAAEEYEQKAIEIHPEFWPSHLLLTKIYLTLEDFDSADESLKRYARIKPNTIVEQESLGWIKFGRGDFAGAWLIFDQLRSYDSASEGARLGYYCAARASKAFIEAESIAERFSEKTKKDPRYIKCSKIN